ncbi:type II toxin-antitoxin system Phd/YefM family antitoxin [Oscillatoria salina]|uniref:type II toxin-antitoxin system Phd/YefM family antitoxin n=1 Tax=Oscillatoria salina TaxID=331517 RepID=UPI001CC99FE7|nr:type II toxin-antitoxin system Phd/YefM family antitoxin [Oscillatoria salina]
MNIAQRRIRRSRSRFSYGDATRTSRRKGVVSLGARLKQNSYSLTMAKYLTIAEAQEQLPELPNELASEPAIITKDGKPVIVALSLSQFQSLLETVEILSDREFMTQLQLGIQQANAGETISLEDLKAELEF